MPREWAAKMSWSTMHVMIRFSDTVYGILMMGNKTIGKAQLNNAYIHCIYGWSPYDVRKNIASDQLRNHIVKCIAVLQRL